MKKIFKLGFFLIISSSIMAQVPNISSLSCASGPIGTLVTITGTFLNIGAVSTSIGGVSGIIISNTGTSLVAMVMPGASIGAVSVTTSGGTAIASGSFTVTPTPYPSTQQGSKLVGTGSVGIAGQGFIVSVSADGNTAIIGGSQDNSNTGAAWVFIRNGSTWTQQGGKLVGSSAVSVANPGFSVSLSADGNTAMIGQAEDNNKVGAAWVFTRTAGVWTQQGSKLVGTGSIGNSYQGRSVSLSADGNTAMVAGYGDNAFIGAVWVYVRIGSTWIQQGNKLVGTGAAGNASQGMSVSLSADGNTAIVGGYGDSNYIGAAWVYTRNGSTWAQQGNKLVANDFLGVAWQGFAVSLSADGNTAMVGGQKDNSLVGAAWVFIRNSGVWTQQGSKLVGSGAVGTASIGMSVSLSADGNTAMVGGQGDNSIAGAAWVYTRSGTTWIQRGGKLVGTGTVGAARQGSGVSISADGSTAIVGGWNDNSIIGAAWIYVPSCISANGPYGANKSICAGTKAILTATRKGKLGWYSSATGGIWLSGDTIYTTPILNADTAYYVQDSICSASLIRTRISIKVNPIKTSSFSQTICSNKSYFWNGIAQKTTGAYKDTFPSYQSCDSVVTLNLTVNPIKIFSFNQAICVNQSYMWNGIAQTTAGAYKDTFPSYQNCDSVVTMNLIVNPLKTSSFNQTICANQSYIWNGIAQTTTGAYKDTFPSYQNCDSVVTLNLTVNPIKTFSFNQIICANQSYIWNGIAQTTTGVYKDTFPSYQNCDSVVTLNLTVNPIKTYSFSQIICANQLYIWNGIAQNITGAYKDTFPSYQNCDSVVTLNLIVNPIKTFSFNQIICAYQSYIWNGIAQNITGAYKDTFPSYQNCDSIVTLNLTVNPKPDITTSVSSLNITANQGSASYQWINCQTSTLVLGATSKVFVAPGSGSYKVAINLNNCKDTSNCVSVIGTSNINLFKKTGLNIYPNPTTSKLTMSFELKQSEQNKLEVYDVSGRIMFQQELNMLMLHGTTEINVEDYPDGIYYIYLLNQNESYQIRFVKE